MNEDESTYLFRRTPEEQDLARLISLEGVLNPRLGLLPASLPSMLFSALGCLVDIGAGAGELTTEVARRYPELLVLGLDVEPARLQYAQDRARLAGVGNVRFVQGNALSPDSWGKLREIVSAEGREISVIHGRLLLSFIRWNQWPAFLRYCHESLGNEGRIVLVEAGALMGTTGESTDEILSLFGRMLVEYGALPSDGNGKQGLAPYLGELVSRAGFREVEIEEYPVEASSTSVYLIARQLETIVLSSGWLTEEEWKALLESAMREWRSPDFRGTTPFRRISAIK